MKTTLLAILAIALLAPLTGCINVEEDEPEAVSTTTTQRTISTTAPTATTVERTTVY
jgi:ABC-type cobalamin/Fe3+-siderophores transport system ATPase subunit